MYKTLGNGRCLENSVAVHIFEDEDEGENVKKFQLAPMGVLAPGSAHARPFARPGCHFIFGFLRVTTKVRES